MILRSNTAKITSYTDLNLRPVTQMMMMNCFCGMFDRRKAFSLLSSRDHCQRSSPCESPTRREQEILGKHVHVSYRIVTDCQIGLLFTLERYISYDFCIGQKLERFQR